MAMVSNLYRCCSDLTLCQLERIQKLMNKVSKPKRQYQRGRDIDFSTYCHRFIALRFSYMGEGYDGLARQNNTDVCTE